MNKIKTFFRKVKYALTHGALSVENVVLVAAVILCLSLTYQSILAMSRNWELSERLTEERKNLELATVEVEAAELENAYYQTDEYLELVARKNLDKKMPGENMVVMPENSEAAKNKHKQAIPVETEVEISNFEKWKKFLFPSY